MTKSLISKSAQADINLWIDKYPPDQKQSAVMAALTIVQDENGGWLSRELIDAVAQFLSISAVSVYEVATFYSMYQLKPVGKHKVCVCTNISCLLRGSEEIVDHVEDKLGIKMNETTPDNLVTLKEVECLGACAGAPAMQIGDTYHENLTPEKIDHIFKELK